MRLSEKLRAEIEAGHARVMPMQFVRDADALEEKVDDLIADRMAYVTRLNDLEARLKAYAKE